MKDFIKNRVRLMLEGVGNVITEASKYPTQKNVNDFLALQSKYHQLYAKDPYFMNANEGNGVYKVTVTKFGNVTSKRSFLHISQIKGRSGWVPHDKEKDYLQFYVAVDEGIEHPEDIEVGDKGAVTRKKGEAEHDEVEVPITKGISLQQQVQKPGSPASDANVKTHLIYGDMIVKFMEGKFKKPKVTYTSDDSGAKIAAAKNSPELAAKVQGKMDDLEKERTKLKTDTPDANALEIDYQELVQKKFKGGGLDKVEEKELKKITKAIAAIRNSRKSGKSGFRQLNKKNK